MGDCNCLVPWLDGDGNHSPGCAVFTPCRGCHDTGVVYESQNDVHAYCSCPAGERLMAAHNTSREVTP